MLFAMKLITGMRKQLLKVIIITVYSALYSGVMAQSLTDTTAAGKGMPVGMDIRALAKTATLRHYPLPDDVLGYQKQVELTAAQVSQLQAIIKTLNMKKAEIRQSVTANEKILNKLFDSRKPEEGALIFYGNRYGLYEGEMRTAVLNACAQTGRVLTPRQNTKFEQLQKPNE
jgi:Spy/CpxP family protein refolding chaperone